MPQSSHHPIMLCQPDDKKSCGACCGLYNWHDHSRDALNAILKLQTELFLSHSNYDNLNSYRVLRNRALKNTKLFETIYNCEFLGFIDTDHKKVGCMLHPEVTGSTELRNHCFYGAKVCNEHFCPSFSCLSTTQQQSVVRSVDDWYLYGLVITDIDLVKEFFKHIENKIGESIKEKNLGNPGITDAFGSFYRLKQDWKFKARQNRLGKYYFSEAEYNIARIEYGKEWGVPPSRFDKILVSLESEFSSLDQLNEADIIIDEKLTRFIRVYSTAFIES